MQAQTGLADVTPDAYHLLGVASPPREAKASLWGRQKGKRSDILRKARCQIAESGLVGFNVHELAHSCNMSRQTVYNLVGDRHAILRDAILQHKSAIIGAAGRLPGYPNYCLSLIDLLWCSTAKNPDYMWKLSRAYHSAENELVDIVRPQLLAALMSGLEPLERSDQVRPGVALASLARRLLLVASVTALDVGEHSPIAELRGELIANTGTVLLAALRPPLCQRLDQWIETAAFPPRAPEASSEPRRGSACALTPQSIRRDH